MPYAETISSRDSESREHLRGHGEPGNDDVGACGIETGHRRSLIRRHILEHVEDVLELHARQASAGLSAPFAHPAA